MRHTFVRSMRGHSQSESVVPWRGYVLWVGGALLALFFAADALMPPPAANPYTSATAKMPTIRIHSEVKGPEAVVIDAREFVRPEFRYEQVEASELHATAPLPEQTGASVSASASPPVAGVRETFAQLAPQAEVAVAKRASRGHPSHSDRARIRKTQPH